jgi:hypothetical protein
MVLIGLVIGYIVIIKVGQFIDVLVDDNNYFKKK